MCVHTGKTAVHQLNKVTSQEEADLCVYFGATITACKADKGSCAQRERETREPYTKERAGSVNQGAKI